jgi:hypothetical protein
MSKSSDALRAAEVHLLDALIENAAGDPELSRCLTTMFVDGAARTCTAS